MAIKVRITQVTEDRKVNYTVCDRCGKEYDNKDKRDSLTLKEDVVAQSGSHERALAYDVCKVCIKEVKAFIKAGVTE
jgi:protein-arginine kinase activator protein McsA